MNPNQFKDIQALVQTVKDFDPNKLAAEVISAGEEWADQDAAASSLEETKKAVIAKITLEYMEAGTSSELGQRPKPMSATAAELRALADPRVEQHIELMVHARREANKFRVRYDMGRMKLELMRSLQATLRNEMRIAGHTN